MVCPRHTNARVTTLIQESRFTLTSPNDFVKWKHSNPASNTTEEKKKVFKDTCTQRYKAQLKIWPWRASDLAEYVPARQSDGQTDSIALRTRPPNCGSALRLPDSRLKNNQPAWNNNSSKSAAPDELKENKKREAAAYPPLPALPTVQLKVIPVGLKCSKRCDDPGLCKVQRERVQSARANCKRAGPGSFLLSELSLANLGIQLFEGYEHLSWGY